MKEKFDRAEMLTLGVRLHELFFKDPDFGLFICEFDVGAGTFTKVGESSLTLLGYRAEEIVGKRVEDFTHPDDVLITYNEVNSLDKKTSNAFINRYRAKDGSYKWMTWWTTGVNKLISLAEVRDMAEVCNLCNDPFIRKLRENIDPSLRRLNKI